jgi:hypothetical protein
MVKIGIKLDYGAPKARHFLPYPIVGGYPGCRRFQKIGECDYLSWRPEVDYLREHA